jgi:hypothetical protein
LERVHAQDLLEMAAAAAAAAAGAGAKASVYEAGGEEKDDLYRMFVSDDGALVSQRYEELMLRLSLTTYRDRPVCLTLNRLTNTIREEPVPQRKRDLKKLAFLLCARFDPLYWAAFGQRCQASRFHMVDEHLTAAFTPMIRECRKTAAPEFQSAQAFLDDVVYKIRSNYDPYGRYEKLYSRRVAAKPGAPIVLTTTLP